MKRTLFIGLLVLTLLASSIGVLAEEGTLTSITSPDGSASTTTTSAVTTTDAAVTTTNAANTTDAAVTTTSAVTTTGAASTTTSAVTTTDEDATTTSAVTTTGAATTAVAVTPTGIDKNDPLYISLKEKYQKLIALRETEANLLKSILEQRKFNNQSNKNYEKTLRSKMKNGKGNGKDKTKDKINAAGNELSILMKQRESLKNRHKSEKALKGKGKSTKDETNDDAVNQEIDKLESRIKAKQDEVKALEESSKNEAAPEALILEAAKKGSEQIRSIKKETLKLNTEINKLQASLNKEWAAFSKSIRIKDLKAANTNMDNILNYKQQIIDKLTGILELKKQINSVLSGSGVQNTSGGTANTTGTTDTTDTTSTTDAGTVSDSNSTNTAGE